MIPFKLIGETRNAIILAAVVASLASVGGLYIKGRYDGAYKERAKWEDVQNKKRIEQAYHRITAQKKVDELALKLAVSEKQKRKTLQSAQEEVRKAQADFEAQTSIMDDQLFNLQKIIISLQEKDVDPEVIKQIKAISANKRSPARDARNERLRGALNSIR